MTHEHGTIFVLRAIWLPGQQVFRAPESSGHAPGAVKSPIAKPLGQHHGQLHAWGRPSLLGWGPPEARVIPVPPHS